MSRFVLPFVICVFLPSALAAGATMYACSVNMPTLASNGATCLAGAYGCSASEDPFANPPPYLLKPNPGITWSAVTGAGSYAVLMEDYTNSLNFVHWFVQSIPASTTSLTRSTTMPSSAGIETNSTFSSGRFCGPCGDNKYKIWVFAMKDATTAITPPTAFSTTSCPNYMCPRSSSNVLKDLASKAIGCTYIAVNYNKTASGSTCTDPSATSCTPSTTTSTGTCPLISAPSAASSMHVASPLVAVVAAVVTLAAVVLA